MYIYYCNDKALIALSNFNSIIFSILVNEAIDNNS